MHFAYNEQRRTPCTILALKKFNIHWPLRLPVCQCFASESTTLPFKPCNHTCISDGQDQGKTPRNRSRCSREGSARLGLHMGRMANRWVKVQFLSISPRFLSSSIVRSVPKIVSCDLLRWLLSAPVILSGSIHSTVGYIYTRQYGRH
jgi:hypothetical protein